MGVYPLIEIYLFINPLDRCSVKAEEALLKFSNNSTEKVKLTIIPVVNPKIIAANFDYQRVDLDTRNAYMHLAYKVALDFKAAQIQGKKIASKFLLMVQHQIFARKRPYPETLVKEFFTKNGDYSMFLEDRTSELVKELFWKDQEIARKFNISSEASAIVYNCTHDGSGLLMTGLETIQEIPYLNYLQDQTTFDRITHKNKAYN